jgi:hypothetical protein
MRRRPIDDIGVRDDHGAAEQCGFAAEIEGVVVLRPDADRPASWWATVPHAGVLTAGALTRARELTPLVVGAVRRDVLGHGAVGRQDRCHER